MTPPSPPPPTPKDRRHRHTLCSFSQNSETTSLFWGPKSARTVFNYTCGNFEPRSCFFGDTANLPRECETTAWTAAAVGASTEPRRIVSQRKFHQTLYLRAKTITIAVLNDWKKTHTIVKSLLSRGTLGCWIALPAYWRSEFLRNRLGQMAEDIISAEQTHLASCCANRVDVAERARCCLDAKFNL